MKGLPTRCVDPVMKCCQDCAWGYRKYGDDAECSADLAGCCFESGCTECGSNFFFRRYNTWQDTSMQKS